MNLGKNEEILGLNSADAGKTQGFALWFTGLPAAGKTTLATAVATQLCARGLGVEVLDSDELRHVLTPNPRYDEAERDWFYGVMVYMGQLLVRQGVAVLFAATATRRAYRDIARQSIPRFAEIYVSSSLATVQKRDPKGIYAKAAAGEIANLPGVGTPYEVPLQPEVVVDTETQSVAAGAEAIMAYLETTFLRS